MKNLNRKWIAERLKEIRKQMKINQEQAAEFMGVKIKTYQSYEEDRAQPNIFLIRRFCNQIMWTVDKFLEGCPENMPQTAP